MDGRGFDDLARHVASGDRRRFLRGATAVLLAVFTIPTKANARSQGLVVLGGACASVEECQLVGGPGPPLPPSCADNGFTSDGALNCCVERGSCCGSDADCCGDLRCFPWPDVCYSCQMPPFPMRGLGQPCIVDSDCIPYPPNAHCVGGLCASPAFPSPEPRPPSDDETALAAAEHFSELETKSQFDTLYDAMHPDAQRVIPREAVVGWYQNDLAPRGPEVAEVIKVRFVPWTWEVNGKTYPETADVTYRQRFADGSEIRGEVRLVKDYDGNWSWFFGRDRSFVEEQIARFGASDVSDTGTQP